MDIKHPFYEYRCDPCDISYSLYRKSKPLFPECWICKQLLTEKDTDTLNDKSNT